MKKIFSVLILSFFLAAGAKAQDKSLFDLNNNLKKSKSVSSVQDFSSKQLVKEFVSASLISGGYFTLGTNKGKSFTSLDDNCSLTFGHPFALTSFPVFAIDGNWSKADDYYASSENVKHADDTLSISYLKEGNVSYSFSIISYGMGDSVQLIQKFKNLDSVSHSFAPGLFLDPALGKWGDGALEYQNNFLDKATEFKDTEVPSQFSIWEKSTGAKGISLDFSFSENPADMIAANWNDVYKNLEPGLNDSLKTDLYDLYLKFYWKEKVLQPGAEKEWKVTLYLGEPDFSKAAILRWDLPRHLNIDNNLIFPKDLTSYVEIDPVASLPASSTLKLTSTSEIYITSPEVELSGSSNTIYKKVILNSKIVYANKIAHVSAQYLNNNQVVDEIERNIFIPATPVSDTGLTVIIDTAFVNQYSKTNVLFKVKQDSNNYFLGNLSTENIFFYENGIRKDYDLMKDTSGGVNAADIIFVLDVTGSMGNEINAVKNNIIEFADSLSYRGIDFRLGMVTFLDEVENIYPFTDDVQKFRDQVAAQYAHGGADEPENSLQALLDATKFSFRNDSKRIVVWITDASYHQQDSYTQLFKDDVIQPLLLNNLVVYCIGTENYKSEYYDPIINPTGGNYYNINGNFRDILLEISRLKGSYKYLLSYQGDNVQQGTLLKIEVSFAGLGGSAEYSFNHSALTAAAVNHLGFYPNPFNPEITFQVNKSNYASGTLQIYNILGQRVRQFDLTGQGIQKLKWNATNEKGLLLSSGFYIVQLVLKDKTNKTYSETAKILYLK